MPNPTATIKSRRLLRQRITSARENAQLRDRMMMTYHQIKLQLLQNELAEVREMKLNLLLKAVVVLVILGCRVIEDRENILSDLD